MIKLQETREEMLARWESQGTLFPECPGCRRFYESPDLPCNVEGPRHVPVKACKSGGLLHCTCEMCYGN